MSNTAKKREKRGRARPIEAYSTRIRPNGGTLENTCFGKATLLNYWSECLNGYILALGGSLEDFGRGKFLEACRARVLYACGRGDGEDGWMGVSVQ